MGNAVDTITITPTFTDSGASVTKVTLGGTDIADTDFTDGISVPSLAEGENTIVVTVTAEDGTTTKSYTVVVTRASAGTNTPATGEPGFMGTPQVGETLTATIGDMADTDLLPTTTFPLGYTFQWVLVDGVTETDITTAMSHTYVPVASDAGKTLKVNVSFTDGGGASETRSAATQPVAGAKTTCPTGYVWCTEMESGYSSDAVGATTLEQGGYLPSTSFGALALDNFTHAGTGYTVTAINWSRVTQSGTVQTYALTLNTGAELPDGTVLTLNGTALTVGTDSHSATVGQEAWDLRALGIDFDWVTDTKVTTSLNFPNTPATGAPGFTGTPQVGETLTATKGDMADTHGLPTTTFPTGYTFQWVLVDGVTETDIASATSQTYVPVASDAGKTLKVKVSFTDGGGASETLPSAATQPVAGAKTTCPTGYVWCTEMESGYSSDPVGATTLEQGGYLPSTSFGALALDNFTHAGTGYTVTAINWSRVTQSGTVQTYALTLNTGAELPDGTVLTLNGTALTVGTDSHSATVGQEAWDLRALGIDFDWVTDTKVTTSLNFPGNNPATGAPGITGTPQVGETLTATIGDIADGDDLPTTTFPTGYTFQWVLVDGVTETDIASATSQTYVPVASDAGKTLKVKVSFTDGGGASETRPSAATQPVATPPPTDCPADADWCATLSVEEFDVGGFVVGHGFFDADSSVDLRQDFGALSDGDFTYAGTPYDVWIVSLDTATNPTLQLRFSPSGETVFGRAGFVLNVGGQAFNLSDATFDTATDRFQWASSGLSWSDGDTVTVSLKFAPPSSDATLSALALADSGDNAVAFNETFAPGTVTYTANVDNAVSTLTVTPTANDANAGEPEFLDANDAALGDAYTMIDGFQVALGVGDTTFKVKVTAEDGTTETYTVTVTRPAPPAPMQESLVQNISGGTCIVSADTYSAQRFTTGTHVADVAYEIDRVVMRLTVAVGSTPQGVVKIRENNTSNRPGDLVAELTSPGTLTDGNNIFSAPSDLLLAEGTRYWITTNEGVMGSANRAVYCAESRNSETGKPGWTISDNRLVKSSESDAWVTNVNSLALRIQGTVLSSDATLRALALTDGDGEVVALTPAFAIDEVSYTASVASAVDKVTVTATPKHANAAEPEFLDGTDATLTDADTGTPGFQVVLAEGENTIKVKVTAEDRDTTETYTVTVTRRPAASAAADDLRRPGEQHGQDQTTSPTQSVMLAQRFETGSHADGYTISEVGVRMGSSSVGVRIRKNSNGEPGDLVAELTSTGMATGGVRWFSAPAGTRLDGGESYWITVNEDASELTFTRTVDDAEDSGAADGWTIGNGFIYRASTAHAWISDTHSLMIAIKGEEADTAAPELESAVVPASGDELVLTFDEDLDISATDLPAASAFTVEADGVEVTVDGVSADMHDTLMLSLSRSIFTGQTVTVSYAVPGTGKVIEDAQGNDAEAFTDQPVTNDSTVPKPSTDALSDATLSALELADPDGNPVELTPAFAADVPVYRASVANAVEAVTVTATKNEATAADPAFLDEMDATLTDADGVAAGFQFALAEGDNTIRVRVTAADLVTTETYTVVVTRARATLPTLPTGGALVSNLNQGNNANVNLLSMGAQGFTTGSVGTLTGVDIVSADTNGRSFTAKLCTTNASGNPTNTCTDLTAPSSFAAGTLSFTAPADTDLAAGTTYAVVINPSTGVELRGTLSDDEDAGKAQGWSIANARQHHAGGTIWSNDSQSRAFRIAIHGSATDTTAPTLESAAVPAPGDKLELTFDEDLDISATDLPPASAFTVEADGEVTVTGVTADEYDVLMLSLSRPIYAGETVTVSYAKPGSGKVIEDGTGNETAAFTDYAVTNGSTLPVPGPAPCPTYANWCTTLTVGTNMDSTAYGWKGPSAYGSIDDDDIEYGGTTWALTHIQHGGGQMSVKLPDSIHLGTVFNLGGSEFVADETSERSTGVYGWTLPAGFVWFVDQKVTVSANLPPTLVSAMAVGTGLVLTYAEDLDTGSVPAPGQYEVKVDGGAAENPSNVSISGKKVTLTLASGVTSGQAVTLSYMVPATDPVQDPSGLKAAALTDRAVETEDTTPPAPESGEVVEAGDSVLLNFDEDLDISATDLPSASVFTVKADGDTVAVSTVATAHGESQIRLLLSAAIERGQTVTVSYTKPPSGKVIADAEGNETASFDDFEVTNNSTVDTTPPAPESGEVETNGIAMGLFFDEDLDITQTDLPPASAFAVEADGVAVAVDGVFATGGLSKLTLSLSAAIYAGQTVTVSYTKPVSGKVIEDAKGNDTKDFDDFEVTNNSTVDDPGNATGQPTLSGTAEAGQTLTASTSGISDPDGKTKAENGDAGYAYTYRWYRVDSDGVSNRTEISGATSKDYTLTADDVGRKIIVEAAFVDDTDVREGPLASDPHPATGTVTATDPSVPAVVSGIAFTNEPADGVYNPGDVIEVTVTFDKAVDVTGSPRLKIVPYAGAAVYAGLESSAGTARTLVFRHTVTGPSDGRLFTSGNGAVLVNANTLELNGGTIRNPGTTTDANLDHALVAGLEVNTRLVEDIFISSTPRVPAADTGGVKVFGPGDAVEFTVRFSDTITVSGTPTLGIKAGTINITADYSSGGGTNELHFEATMPDPFREHQNIRVADNDIATNGLQRNGATLTDSGGRAVNVSHEEFERTAVLDGLAPQLLATPEGATVNGKKLELSYRYNTGTTQTDYLDPGSEPGPADFVVSVVGGSAVAVASVAIPDLNTVRLTLASPVDEGTTVTVSYTPGTDPVQDAGGNDAVAFANRAVRNDTPEAEKGDTQLTDGQGNKLNPTGGTVEGRLEVFFRGKWGSVCDDRFDRDFDDPGTPNDTTKVPNRAAHLACRWAKFETGAMVSNAGKAAQTLPIWLDDVRCVSESDKHWRPAGSPDPTGLHHCYNAGVSRHNCKPEEDVWLECTGKLESATQEEEAALTAAFEDVPGSHDGATPFTFRIVLSEAIANDADDVRDNVVKVTGGSVGSATAVNGQTDEWQITVDPDGAGDITLTVEAGGTCGDPGVLCTAGGEGLSETVTGTVEGPAGVQPLTAQFENGPGTHDGTGPFNVFLRFSEAPANVKNIHIKGALTIAGGTILRVRVVGGAGNDEAHRRVEIEPAGDGDVRLSLFPTTDCAATNALCTADGRKLESLIGLSIPGPASAPPPSPAHGVVRAGPRGARRRERVQRVPALQRSARQREEHPHQGGAHDRRRHDPARARRRWRQRRRSAPAGRDRTGGRRQRTAVAVPDRRLRRHQRALHRRGRQARDRDRRDDPRTRRNQRRRRHGRRGGRSGARVRGQPRPGAARHGDGGLRDRERHRDGGRGLHGRVGHADLRRGRDGEDRRGRRARRPARRGQRDAGAEALEPVGGADCGRRGDGDDREHRPDAAGVARAVRAHGGGAGDRGGGDPDAGAAEPGRRGEPCGPADRARAAVRRGCGAGGRGGAGSAGAGDRGGGRGRAAPAGGVAEGRGGGRGAAGPGDADGDGARAAAGELVLADRGARGRRARRGVAVGPGGGVAFRRARGRAHAGRRGGERAAGRGLGARAEHAGPDPVAQPRRWRLPRRGRLGHGLLDADGALSLGPARAERPGDGVGRCGLRRGHADADA